MRILIDIEKIKGTFSSKGPIRIKLKIGTSMNVWTELSNYSDGIYPFLEKHLISLQQDTEKSYIEIAIVAQDGSILGQITVFLIKFKEFNKIQIKSDSEVYQLHYSLKEIADDSQMGTMPRRVSQVEEQPPSINEQSRKLQILRLGVLMFNFSQRLDPLVYVYNYLIAIITWKSPFYTIFIAIFLTIAVYYIKTFIFLGGICLFFGKDFIFKKLSTIHRYRNLHKRMMVPKENAFFLQQIMDIHCAIYQNVSNFLFNDDKTTLINLINFICKACIVLVMLLSLFHIEALVILSLWTILLVDSPFSHKIAKNIKPILYFLVGEYDKIFDKVTMGISNMIGNQISNDLSQISKQFYYYYYERWWVLKGWCDQTKKYSDEMYEAILFPREKAPQGWAWIEEWKIDFDGDVDSSGYQYANDLIAQFKSKTSIPIRRRRKWKRICVKLRQELIE